MASEQECRELIEEVSQIRNEIKDKARALTYWTIQAREFYTRFATLAPPSELTNLLNAAMTQKELYADERGYQERLDRLHNYLQSYIGALNNVRAAIESSKPSAETSVVPQPQQSQTPEQAPPATGRRKGLLDGITNAIGRIIVPNRAFKGPITEEIQVQRPTRPLPNSGLLRSTPPPIIQRGTIPQQLALPAPKKMLALPPPSPSRVIPMGSASGVNKLPSGQTPIKIWPAVIEKKRYDPDAEAETRRRLESAGLVSPYGQPQPTAAQPTREPERVAAAGSERESEERDDNMGIIRGVIKDKSGHELEDVVYVQIESPFLSRPIPTATDENSTYQSRVPTRPGGLDYLVTVTDAGNYKKPRPKRVEVFPGKEAVVNFELDQDEELFKKKRGEDEAKRLGKTWMGREKLKAKEGSGFNILSIDWWMGRGHYENEGAHWPRFVVALGLTLFFYFALYRPTFSALGQNLGWANWMIPIVFGILMFYTVPPLFGKEKKNISPFIMACVYGIGSWVGLTFFTNGVGHASFIQWGVPLAMYLIGFNLTKKKGISGSVVGMLPIIFIGGIITLAYTLVSSGDAFQIETYLKVFDVLRLVGIPQHSIDTMKDGVRSTLGALAFNSAAPEKPQAKKIGGFEAIQVRFGTQSNNYQLPTLYARSEYTLPITVANPNKLETSAVVEDFRISDIVMYNGSSNRLLCGGEMTCPAGSISNISDGSAKCCADGVCKPAEKYVKKIGDIRPEDEQVLTVDFRGKTISDPTGSKQVDCRFVLNSGLAPLDFKVPFENKDTGKTSQDCSITCGNVGGAIVRSRNSNLHLTPLVDELDTSYYTYHPVTNECGCRIKQYNNELDNLCHVENSRTTIELSSTYNFNVQGKGELILLKSYQDKKIAPRPAITSSAGPLTVTTYFVPDINSLDGKLQARNMFIDIRNDGDGTANILEFKINSKQLTQSIPLDDSGKIIITKCSPDPQKLLIDKDTATIICSIEMNADDLVKEGNYKTIPAIIDMKYNYSELHSTSTPVKKVFIPAEVTSPEKIQELKNTYETLPYYCPSDLATYCKYSYSEINLMPKSSVAKGSALNATSTFNKVCDDNHLELRTNSCKSTEDKLGQCTVKDGTCDIKNFNAPEKEGDYQLVLCDGGSTTHHIGTLKVSG